MPPRKSGSYGPFSCRICQTSFGGSYVQARRVAEGKPVFCGASCRSHYRWQVAPHCHVPKPKVPKVPTPRSEFVLTHDGYAICAHCEVHFRPSARQIRRARAPSGSGRVCCSSACQTAQMLKSVRKPMPTHGPCPTCGQMFESRRPKKFCSLKCWTSSNQAKAHLQTIQPKAWSTRVRRLAAKRNAMEENGELPPNRVEYECLECGKKFIGTIWNKRKFCSTDHYRLYMSKRFDRFVASPQQLALPQNYDEFLLQDELPCLVEGCGWVGKWLTTHMNFAHGMPAAEFKRAAGFNLKTGVITPEVRETLSQRSHLQDADWLLANAARNFSGSHDPQTKNYFSLEGREHSAKSRALKGLTEAGPERVCRSCGSSFRQSSPYGLKMYCSIACRSHFYLQDKETPMRATCATCLNEFDATYSQRRRAQDGNPVYCSNSCQGKVISPARSAYFRRRKKASA